VIRFVALVALAALIYLVLRASVASFFAGLRGSGGRARGRAALRDELVKDPVCETYIPRRKAIPRSTGAGTYYFCSAACADKFAARS
jgi:YHS domain-containing protein